MSDPAKDPSSDDGYHVIRAEQVPVTIRFIDEGRRHEVSDITPWIDLRKRILIELKPLVEKYVPGEPASIAKDYGRLAQCFRRLLEIEQIVKMYREARNAAIKRNIETIMTALQPELFKFNEED